MVTLKDIADKCNVSVSAVSLALNHPHKISFDLREKIMKTAREMKYFTKKSKNLKKVVLVVENFERSFFCQYYSEIIFGIQNILMNIGCELRIMNGFDEDFSSIYHCDGMIIVGGFTEKFIDRVRKYRMPHVVAGYFNPIYDLPYVYQDTPSGASILVDYLLSCNHKHIALVSLSDSYHTGVDFISSVTDQLCKRGIQKSDLLMHKVDRNNIDTVEIVFNKILSYDPQITAIMCDSNYLANQIKQSAQRHGVSIPSNISVTGFDSPSIMRRYDCTDVTSAYTNKIEVGMRSVDLLLSMLREPEKVSKDNLVEMKIDIRNTVRRI